ncbi:cation:proton antiporter [Helicobacter cholecystus]|uniref:Cation:proton antiporter n=1 Tax=Helicobacter cholecystus TaxID=45498 RepID=A0A3D8IW94_9HELI|nr:cation:proton antiporter [Helicobacter cholecystus]RDU69502.1 cation:proton antiporter [Helicobacter cholecystus]VEJ24054.1 Na+/H+ antiporter [Helicobacter cholecystus]
MSLISFAIIATLIALAPLLSSLTRIPCVVVEMLLGTLATYIGIFHENESVRYVAEIGFLILMFLCGMEVDLKSFKTLKNEGLFKNIFAYFCILYTLSISLVLLQKLPFIYIVIFPIMGVGMIMTLIKEYGKDYIWLNLALKVGIFGELLSICILVGINGFYTYGLSLELSRTFGVLIIFFIFIALSFRFFRVVFWWFPTLKNLIVPQEDQSNQDLRFSAMLFFIFISIVLLLKLEVALGAFIAGMIIATFFGNRHLLHQKLTSIGFGFFVPFFFVHIGTTLDLKALLSNPQLFKDALMVVTGMLGIRLIGCFLVFRKFLGNIKNVVLYAFSDAMPLTFLIAAATLALQLKIITQENYYAFVMGAMIEGIVFMIIIKLILNYWKKEKK